MGTFSLPHWIILLVVVLLLFGPQRLAGVGKGLGEGIRSFKKGISEDDEDAKKSEPKSLADSKSDKPAGKSENEAAS